MCQDDNNNIIYIHSKLEDCRDASLTTHHQSNLQDFIYLLSQNIFNEPHGNFEIYIYICFICIIILLLFNHIGCGVNLTFSIKLDKTCFSPSYISNITKFQ